MGWTASGVDRHFEISGSKFNRTTSKIALVNSRKIKWRRASKDKIFFANSPTAQTLKKSDKSEKL